MLEFYSGLATPAQLFEQLTQDRQTALQQRALRSDGEIKPQKCRVRIEPLLRGPAQPLDDQAVIVFLALIRGRERVPTRRPPRTGTDGRSA
jgi:hypothetical protein